MVCKTPSQQHHWWWMVGLLAGLLSVSCQLQASVPGALSGQLQADQRTDQTITTGQTLPISAHATVKDQKLELEVAQTKEQQAMGLMYRNSLPDNRGMLFPFAPPQRVSFWMKNVPISLDMIFLRQGKIVEIHTAPPCNTTPCPLYDSRALIDQVIELRGDRAAELGLQKGDQIQVEFLSDQASSAQE